MLVLTSYVDDEHVISAINKGADGYEMKDVEPAKLIETIRRVLAGERIIHPEAKTVMEAVAKNRIIPINYQNEKLTFYEKWSKEKQTERLLKHYLYQKNNKTHVSHILISYKSQIVLKLLFMLCKIT